MELKTFFYKTLIVVGTIAGLYALFQLRSLLLLFFGAILFASTVRPLVLALSKRGIPAILSILVIYLIFLGGLAGVLIVLFPTLIANLQDMIQSQVSIMNALEEALARIEAMAFAGVGNALPMPRVADLQVYLRQFQSAVQENFQAILLDGFRLLSEALILFVLAFYWLTERDRFEELGVKMIPLRNREQFLAILNEMETTLGAYVRGQTILCVTVGLGAFAALWLLGVRSALVLAVFAGVAEAIPMIGPIIGAVPAILIALLDSPEKGLLVLVAYIIIQQLESQLLVPKVMERQVGLSPLFVLLALTAGNLLGGLVGALVAIPIAAAIKIIVREFIVVPAVQARKFPVMEGGAVLISDAEELPSASATGAVSMPVPTTPATPPAPPASETLALPK